MLDHDRVATFGDDARAAVRLGRARTGRRPSRSRGDALRDDVEGEVEVGGHEMQRSLREGQVFAEDVLALALARLVGHLGDRSDTLKAPWATTMLLTMWRSPPAASVMIVPVKLWRPPANQPTVTNLVRLPHPLTTTSS